MNILIFFCQINLFAETKAIKSLKRLRGAKYNYLPELNQLKLERDERKNNEISLRSVLKRQNTIRSLIISLGLMFFQQMCGINVVIFYSTHINVVCIQEEKENKKENSYIIVFVLIIMRY